MYVMDVQFDDETVDVITLDSKAGCSVWPKGRRAGEDFQAVTKEGWGRAGCRERHAHRAPRAEASSFPWCLNELDFSQAEVSRPWCVDHIVRPNSDSKEVVARWVCGQEEEENIEVELEDETENASRTVKKIQDFRKPSKKEHAARNDTFSLSQLVQALRSRPWKAHAAPRRFSGNEYERGAHGLRILGS